MSWPIAPAFVVTFLLAVGLSALLWRVDRPTRRDSRAGERPFGRFRPPAEAATWWPWGRVDVGDLRRTMDGHERLARDHARDAARFLAWRNYDSYLSHLQWQRWHERKADKLRRRIADLERAPR